MNTNKKGRDFESYIAHIYQNLLRLEKDNILISRNLKVKKHNTEHEIDIYYEFVKASILHRVAIECKNWETPVQKSHIASFESVINDIRNLTGVFVSKSGYSSGAIEYANEKGIKTLTLDDLPNFINLMGLNLKNVYMPHTDEPAEPFYTLLGINEDGSWTGSYFYENYKKEGNVLPLFISRKHANDYIKFRKEKNLAVRPLKRGHINLLIDLSLSEHKVFKGMKFSLILIPFIGEKGMPAMEGEDLRNEYLV